MATEVPIMKLASVLPTEAATSTLGQPCVQGTAARSTFLNICHTSSYWGVSGGKRTVAKRMGWLQGQGSKMARCCLVKGSEHRGAAKLWGNIKVPTLISSPVCKELTFAAIWSQSTMSKLNFEDTILLNSTWTELNGEPQTEMMHNYLLTS